MHESNLADPYMTPRTLPARRPINYLVYAIIVALILLTFAAASLMVWRALRPARVILDRGPAIDNRAEWFNQNRSPVRPEVEQSAVSPETAVP